MSKTFCTNIDYSNYMGLIILVPCVECENLLVKLCASHRVTVHLRKFRNPPKKLVLSSSQEKSNPKAFMNKETPHIMLLLVYLTGPINKLMKKN